MSPFLKGCFSASRADLSCISSYQQWSTRSEQNVGRSGEHDIVLVLAQHGWIDTLKVPTEDAIVILVDQ